MASGSALSIVIYGKRGMLATDLGAAISAQGGRSVMTEDRRYRDLPDFDATHDETVAKDFEKTRPNIVFNCVAYTNVDGCEDNQKAANDLNAGVPGRLARNAKQYGSLLVHVSTDFIFDGDTDRPYTEDDPANPLSVYGKSKLAGERAVIESGCDYLICRTAWLYGAHGKNFVTTILRLAAEKDVLRVVADQTGSPTWTADLAEMILALVDAGARGVFHTVNSGSASWFDLASEAVRLKDLPARIEPIPASEFPRKAKPPLRSSVLSVEKYTRAVGRPPRPWQAALADFLSTLPQKPPRRALDAGDSSR
ncbi:MAG: dTDP-4-dehydrorhamnose reductase [Planctomycetota bacterium]